MECYFVTCLYNLSNTLFLIKGFYHPTQMDKNLQKEFKTTECKVQKASDNHLINEFKLLLISNLESMY